jgi:hypothetical protein
VLRSLLLRFAFLLCFPGTPFIPTPKKKKTVTLKSHKSASQTQHINARRTSCEEEKGAERGRNGEGDLKNGRATRRKHHPGLCGNEYNVRRVLVYPACPHSVKPMYMQKKQKSACGNKNSFCASLFFFLVASRRTNTLTHMHTRSHVPCPPGMHLAPHKKKSPALVGVIPVRTKVSRRGWRRTRRLLLLVVRVLDGARLRSRAWHSRRRCVG